MEGAYGCVYRPALECPHPMGSSISKAFADPRDMEEEYRAHQTLNLKEIKNYKHFYITDPIKCPVNPPVVCKNVASSIVLNYADGGRTLFDGHLSPVDLLNGLANIFKGVKQMNQKKRYHLDIKPDNIVIDGNSTFRLIDFGFSKNLSQIQDFTDVWNSRFEESYEYWPIEMMLLEKLRGLTDVVSFLQVKKYLKGYINVLKDDIGILRKKELILDDDPPEVFLNYQDIYDKVDVWGLGVTLCRIYDMLNIQNFYLKSNLLKVIKKILILNPVERPNATEAYAIYKRFLGGLMV
jgi:serine/threonine protein kinase